MRNLWFAEARTWSGSSSVAWECYERRLPYDAPQIGRLRSAMGEEGLAQSLMFTTQTVIVFKVLKPAKLARVIVGSMAQEMAIAHLVDSRLP